MKNNILQYYIADKLISLEESLVIHSQDMQPEGLHQLRVTMKKIKAVFSFAAKVYKKKYNTDKLNTLFKQAGKIRELDFHMNVLLAFQQPPKRLIGQLEKRKKLLIKQFINNISLNLRLVKKYRKKVSLPKRLPSKKAIENYFKKEQQKANKKLEKKDQDNLHKYRMCLKKLLAIYNLLPKKLQKRIELNEAKMNKEQDKLGKWHDAYSSLQFISRLGLSTTHSNDILKLKEKENRLFNLFFKK